MFRLRDWFILGPLAVIGLTLGLWGMTTCTRCQDYGQFGAEVVDTLSLVKASSPKTNGPVSKEGQVLVYPLKLTIAQIMLPLVALFGAGKILLFNLRRDMRLVMASRKSGHVIVCGLGDTGQQIVQNLLAARFKVTAIVLDHDEPNAVAAERLSVPILKGDATQISVLWLAGLNHARGVVVATGSDAANIEVALRIDAEFARDKKRTKPLYVLPEVRSAWLLDLLHTHPTTTLGSEIVDVRPFDLYANAARMILQSPTFRYAFPARQALSKRKPASEGVRPHLLVAGLGEMGTQIIVQAVQSNFAVPGCKLSVTVFDQQGKDAAAGISARFPGLHDLVELSFMQCSFDADNPASWPDVWNDVEAALRGRIAESAIVAVVVSLKEDKDALHTALQLRERLDRQGQFGTPVFVRLRQQRALGQFAANLDGPSTLIDRLIPFGDLGRLTSPEQLIDQPQDSLARTVHEAYLASLGGQPGGNAAVPWARLPERYKQSNRAVADFIPAQLGLVGLRMVQGRQPPAIFTDDEIEIMAAAEHWRWVIERRLAGWRRGTRDDVGRIHPHVAAWSELDEPVRADNRARTREIPRNVAATGMTIRRERIIVSVERGLAGAEAALDTIAPDEQAIVVFDPFDPDSWRVAQSAAARSARLWVLWHHGRRRPPIAPSAVAPELRAAVEAAISVRELAELAPGSIAAPQPAETHREAAAPARRHRGAVQAEIGAGRREAPQDVEPTQDQPSATC
jgi:hypothetical protein